MLVFGSMLEKALKLLHTLVFCLSPCAESEGRSHEGRSQSNRSRIVVRLQFRHSLLWSTSLLSRNPRFSNLKLSRKISKWSLHCLKNQNVTNSYILHKKLSLHNPTVFISAYHGESSTKVLQETFFLVAKINLTFLVRIPLLIENVITFN
jgi:hypothetical protein